MTSQRTYQIIIAILVVIILVGGWIMWHKGASWSMGSTATSTTATSSDDNTSVPSDNTSTDTDTSGSTTSPAQSADTNTAVATTEAVSVADQPAGMSVTVSSVSLNQLGWIAIRDSSGRTLGAGLFPAGTQTNVEVPLLRATEAGQHYQVLLYVDDGDKQFDLHKDALLTGDAGSVIGTNFTAN
jgi:hypothetical protein